MEEEEKEVSSSERSEICWCEGDGVLGCELASESKMILRVILCRSLRAVPSVETRKTVSSSR
jgi:hypothetical protein